MLLSDHQFVSKRDKFIRERLFDNNEAYNYLSKV